MAKTYRPYMPEQDLLLRPSLRDWLPERHLAFFVSDLVDQLDTTVNKDENAAIRRITRHADEGAGVRLLHWRFVVVENPAAVGRRRGVPRAGRRQRTGLRTIAAFRKTH